MKSRAAKFLAAIFASILTSASAFAAPEDAASDSDNTEQPASHCLTSPRDYTPPGTRWRYRVERPSGRHCWFLKDEPERSASKAAAPSAAATEEPAPAPARRKSATSRSVSDARAEISQTPVEQARPAPAPNAQAAAAGAPAIDGNPSSPAKSANMLAPAAATRWPDAMSAQTANPAANPPAPPAEPGADARGAPARTAKPQVMPRAVPPMPVSEKPMSLPMLITVTAGGLSVLGVLVSLLLAWLASRRAGRTLSVPLPPLELSDAPRRPGDLYRERKRMRAKRSGRRAA